MSNYPAPNNGGFGNAPGAPGEFKVSTSLISLFDDTGVQLRLGGLEEALSLAIWIPVIDPASGRKTYPPEMRHNTILTIERLSALHLLLQNDILPAYEKNQNIFRGIFTSNKNINMVGIGVENGEFNFQLHMNISAERIPAETFAFKFSKLPYLRTYDPKTGEFEMDTIDAQFYLFCSCVMMMQYVGATSVSGHSNRYANRRTTDKVFKYLEGISKQLGVVIETPSYGGGAPRGGNFMPTGTGQPTLAAGEMQEVTNLSDLM